MHVHARSITHKVGTGATACGMTPHIDGGVILTIIIMNIITNCFNCDESFIISHQIVTHTSCCTCGFIETDTVQFCNPFRSFLVRYADSLLTFCNPSLYVPDTIAVYWYQHHCNWSASLHFHICSLTTWTFAIGWHHAPSPRLSDVYIVDWHCGLACECCVNTVVWCGCGELICILTKTHSSFCSTYSSSSYLWHPLSVSLLRAVCILNIAFPLIPFECG